MPVKTFKRKPDTVDAFKLEENPDDLRETAKWCNGSLTIRFDNGQIVKDQTFIAFLEGPLPIQPEDKSVVIADNRAASVAQLGDYIIKYWDTKKHGVGFYVVNGARFEEEYELR